MMSAMRTKHLILPFLFSGLFCSVTNQSHAKEGATDNRLRFVENKGQIINQNGSSRSDIDFKIGDKDLNLFVGHGQLHYQWSKPMDTSKEEKQSFSMYRMDVTLIAANPNAKATAEEQQDYSEHYYLAQTGTKGNTANSFQKITYKDIYPNIDWVLYVKNNQVEYDFILRANAKVSDIKIQYNGATNLQLDKEGKLIATTPTGTITENTPNSFQQDGKPIASKFKLHNNTISFETDSYNGTLIIDPTLMWSTYYGGTGNETIKSGCVTGDNNNNAYFSGYTTSAANIATTGSYQSTISTSSDAFLVKFNSNGTRLWATYYGGTGADIALGSTYDPNGYIYLTGYTSSTGMSTTGSHQAIGGGGQDAYLVKFDSLGNRIWATYYGGTGADQSFSVGCDTSSNVYITGTTASNASIATTGSFKATNSGGTDAFLVKFNVAGVRQWATYYGGTDFDQAQVVICDNSNNVFITGYTQSLAGIATTGSQQSSLSALEDAFIVKFDSTGARQWATYYGGTGYDEVYGMKCDATGSIYIGGLTTSATTMGTTGSFQSTYGGGTQDAFLAKFNNAGTKQWSTYIGGAGNDAVYSLCNNNLGNLYLVGVTSSTGSIATAGTFQDTLNGVQDAMIIKFDTAGNRIWSTYFGGELADMGYGIYCNNLSKLFIGGNTKSNSGIATTGANQTTFGTGTGDGFLTAFNDCSLTAPITIVGNDTICIGSQNTYSVLPIAGATSYSWLIPSNWTGASNTNSITITAGNSNDTLKVIANFACGSSTVCLKPIVVNQLPTITPTGQISLCNNDSILLTSSTASSYQWIKDGNAIAGATSQTIYIHDAGLYKVAVISATGGCADTSNTDTVVVHPTPTPPITANGDVISTGSYVTYQWNHNGTAIVGATAATYTVTVKQGTYSVTVTDTNGCTGTSTTYDATPNQVGIHDANGNNNTIQLYPNPATDMVHIQYSGKVNVTIRTMDGRKVATFKNTNSINIQGLDAGVYLLYLTDKDGAFITTQKLVKQIAGSKG